MLTRLMTSKKVGAWLAGSALVLALGACAMPAPAARKVIATADAPAAIGPYSQAVQVGDMLFVSGQLGMDPKTGKIVTDGIRAETIQSMKNLGAILTAAGMSFDDVVQVQIFVADLNDFAAVNEEYGKFFKSSPPTRATVQVARLPRDGKIEIALTALHH